MAVGLERQPGEVLAFLLGEVEDVRHGHQLVERWFHPPGEVIGEGLGRNLSTGAKLQIQVPGNLMAMQVLVEGPTPGGVELVRAHDGEDTSDFTDQ